MFIDCRTAGECLQDSAPPHISLNCFWRLYIQQLYWSCHWKIFPPAALLMLSLQDNTSNSLLELKISPPPALLKLSLEAALQLSQEDSSFSSCTGSVSGKLLLQQLHILVLSLEDSSFSSWMGAVSGKLLLQQLNQCCFWKTTPSSAILVLSLEESSFSSCTGSVSGKLLL